MNLTNPYKLSEKFVNTLKDTGDRNVYGKNLYHVPLEAVFPN